MITYIATVCRTRYEYADVEFQSEEPLSDSEVSDIALNQVEDADFKPNSDEPEYEVQDIQDDLEK